MSDNHPNNFQVGDLVECEMREDHPTEPCWNMARRDKGSGRWVQGKVTKIGSNYIEISLPQGTVGIWEWPRTNHPEYYGGLYDQPGYLRKAYFIKTEGKYKLVDKGSYYGLEKIK